MVHQVALVFVQPPPGGRRAVDKAWAQRSSEISRALRARNDLALFRPCRAPTPLPLTRRAMPAVGSHVQRHVAGRHLECLFPKHPSAVSLPNLSLLPLNSLAALDAGVLNPWRTCSPLTTESFAPRCRGRRDSRWRRSRAPRYGLPPPASTEWDRDWILSGPAPRASYRSAGLPPARKRIVRLS
jgi:hypothetical protein